MTDRIEKRYLSCPWCNKILLRCEGKCTIEVRCQKCNRDMVVIIDDFQYTVFQNRRGK